MSELVARTGRHQQRYEAGSRLVAGCIPYKYTTSCVDVDVDGSPKKVVQVLMISSTSGPGLLFPKGGWENDETVEEAALREALEEAGVRGDIMYEKGSRANSEMMEKLKDVILVSNLTQATQNAVNTLQGARVTSPKARKIRSVKNK